LIAFWIVHRVELNTADWVKFQSDHD